MDRKNKKEAVAALHQDVILLAAEKVFSEKGFEAATIDDISEASNYSRRTLYAYFQNKEEIYQQIVLKGLLVLKSQIEEALKSEADFKTKYLAICQAMHRFSANSPHAFKAINQFKPKTQRVEPFPKVIQAIFETGEEINLLLEGLILSGLHAGVLKADVKARQTVYILWSCISALIIFVQDKGPFLEKSLGTSPEAFLQDGFIQIIQSILVKEV
jgi:AcrR family transcriptional regulator